MKIPPENFQINNVHYINVAPTTFLECKTIMHLVHWTLEKAIDFTVLLVVCGFPKGKVPPNLFYHQGTVATKAIASRGFFCIQFLSSGHNFLSLW